MRYFLLAPLLAATSSVAFAGPLTFDVAIRRAQHGAPSIRAKELATDAARAARGAAGAFPDPTLSVDIDSFPVSGPTAFRPNRDDFSEMRFGFGQTIPNLAKRHAQQGLADASIVAAKAETAVETRNVEVVTALAWIELAFAQRRVVALDDILRRLKGIVNTTTGAVASGNARPAQTIAGQQAIASIQDRRSELVSMAARARAVLARWTGDREPEAVGSIPDFAVDPTALRAAVNRHPSITMVRAQVGEAEAAVRVAEADRRPDFGLNVAYQRRDPRFGDFLSTGVTIGLPIFTRRRQNATIAARQAEAGRARAEQDAAQLALAASLESALADHVMHHEQWLRARDTLQPLAEQRVKLETASYGGGRATLVEVADAYSALAETTLTKLDREALVIADGAQLTLTYRSNEG